MPSAKTVLSGVTLFFTLSTVNSAVSQTEQVTFHKDIEPILQRSCQNFNQVGCRLEHLSEPAVGDPLWPPTFEKAEVRTSVTQIFFFWVDKQNFSVIDLESHKTKDVRDSHINGELTVIWRDWDTHELELPKMVYITSVEPKEKKGPHLHTERNSFFTCIPVSYTHLTLPTKA